MPKVSKTCVFIYINMAVCVSSEDASLRHEVFHSAIQAVGAAGNCGGRELVRAVSPADVNMAMLSWHKT